MGNNQNGFSAIEALLVLFVVGVIGFGGWYVWSHHAKSGSTNQATNSNAVTEQASNPSIVKVADKSSTAGSKFVTEFFSKYGNLPGHNKADEDKLVYQYGNDNFLSYYYGHQAGSDPIICGQAFPPAQHVTSKTVAGAYEILTIADDRVTDSSGDITVKVLKTDKLQIVSWVCPGSIPETAPDGQVLN